MQSARDARRALSRVTLGSFRPLSQVETVHGGQGCTRRELVQPVDCLLVVSCQGLIAGTWAWSLPVGPGPDPWVKGALRGVAVTWVSAPALPYRRDSCKSHLSGVGVARYGLCGAFGVGTLFGADRSIPRSFSVPESACKRGHRFFPGRVWLGRVPARGCPLAPPEDSCQHCGP